MRSPSKWGFTYISITEAYIEVTSRVGAVPVLIPLGLPEEDLSQLERTLDGIIFTGGGDIDPNRYGGKHHPSVSRVDPDRDRVEIHLARGAIENGTPFLAICRGMQIVNIAMGGSLYTDIADQHPNALRHDYFSSANHSRSLLAHPVLVQEHTHTSRIFGKSIASVTPGTSLEVNSLHHQAVNRLAPGLIPTAYATDGILEGFELPDHPYGIAVQWHPEWLADQAPMRALFEGLAKAVNGAT